VQLPSLPSHVTSIASANAGTETARTTANIVSIINSRDFQLFIAPPSFEF
jgi:hypothetical protein